MELVAKQSKEVMIKINIGSSFLLPVHGRLGQEQHLTWRRISQSEIQKIAAAEKRSGGTLGRGGIPPTPPFRRALAGGQNFFATSSLLISNQPVVNTGLALSEYI